MSDRCLESGEEGTEALEAPTTDFEGGRAVTRVFTAEAGVSPPLLRVGVGLNGDADLGGPLNGDTGREDVPGVPVAVLVVLLELATELVPETFRPIVALLFTLALGRDNGGDKDG